MPLVVLAAGVGIAAILGASHSDGLVRRGTHILPDLRKEHARTPANPAQSSF